MWLEICCPEGWQACASLRLAPTRGYFQHDRTVRASQATRNASDYPDEPATGSLALSLQHGFIWRSSSAIGRDRPPSLNGCSTTTKANASDAKKDTATLSDTFEEVQLTIHEDYEGSIPSWLGWPRRPTAERHFTRVGICKIRDDTG